METPEFEPGEFAVLVILLIVGVIATLYGVVVALVWLYHQIQAGI